MNELGKLILAFLVFPGFLFTAAAGLLLSWVDRKVTARVQWRVGPPWYQPLIDIVKLMGKETIVPRDGSKITFLLAPLFGLAAVTLVATILGLAILYPQTSFIGDLIVVLYLLVIPSLALIIGGSAARNPLSSLGVSREIKLVLSYELPFILAAFVPVIITGGIKFSEILSYQQASGALLIHPSAIIAFIVALFVIQAKLTAIPFDIPEAETEISSGIFIEYSGTPLAILKLNRAMLLFVLPVFLVTLFAGGMGIAGWDILWGILKIVGIIVLVILIRNTNPRIRIDQAVRFFWGPMTILAIASVILAFLGW